MAEASGERLGKFVGLDQPPTLVARALPLAEFTATRVRWSDSGSGTPSRFNRNNGYLGRVDGFDEDEAQSKSNE